LAATQVAIVRDVDLRERIVKAVELLGGLGKVVDEGASVFIKPNLVDGAPAETGETTHPEAIKAMVELCYEAGAREVVVGETDSSRGRRARLFARIAELVKPLGANVVDLDTEPFPEVQVPDPVRFAKVRLAKRLLDCDVYVSLPTLKTHDEVGVTVSIKNMYGCISRRDKIDYHRLGAIEEVIVDLNAARKPDVTIVDGTYSTFHFGPRKEFPETHRLDLALAGFDPVAVDTVAAKVIGVDPRTIRYLTWAEERALGVTDEERIETVGLPVREAYRKNTTTCVEYDNQHHAHVRLLDYGSCTGCYGRIATLVLMANDEKMQDDLCLQMGPGAKPIREKKVLLCGSCAAPTFYNRLVGTFIPGCPPDLAPIAEKLEAVGAVFPSFLKLLFGKEPPPQSLVDQVMSQIAAAAEQEE